MLRSVSTQPDWPDGDPAIALWLGRVLLREGRHSEAASAVERWARSGDVECMAVRWTAMLALGQAREVAEAAQHMSRSTGHVTVQLVHAEALLDLDQGRCASEFHAEARQVLAKLGNMRSLGVRLDPWDESKFEELLRRVDGPFGFGRRN